jgi:DNA-binding NarL/FixJ family response regulator
LKHILSETGDIAVAGEAADGEQTLAALRETAFEALVLDLNMPGRNGIELIRRIKEEFPDLPILVLSMYKEDIYAVRALKAGASGYLCKDNAEARLAEAIRKVASGGLFINPNVAESLARGIRQKDPALPPHQQLTERAHQIFLMLAQGQSVSEIAHRLNLSVKTVSTHKSNIQARMNLANTAEIVRYAISHHLIESDTPAD